MVIKQTVLDHKGGWYFYRFHDLKLNGNGLLRNYLERVFENCPDHYFNSGPRSSALKFKLPIDIKKVEGHEVSELCRRGLDSRNHKSAHFKVQAFMLETDDKTVAVEVPIWLKSGELKDFSGFFNTNEPLSGHIDLLRLENGKVWIWDYKPNANREKYAATQVYFYSLMLSKRTNIDLDEFRCGYFDSNYAYIFKPDKKLAMKNMLISDY